MPEGLKGETRQGDVLINAKEEEVSVQLELLKLNVVLTRCEFNYSQRNIFRVILHIA